MHGTSERLPPTAPQLVDERDPAAREALRLQEVQEREAMARANELGLPRLRADRGRVSAFEGMGGGDGSHERLRSETVPGARGNLQRQDFTMAGRTLPAIRRGGRDVDAVRLRQRSQAIDRLGQVGELEARRRRVLGPVFLP